jgi:hypothetical protein
MKHLLTLLVLLILGCSQSEQWKAFVYPDIDNVPTPDKSENYIIGDFQSFEQCQAAAIGAVRANLATTGKQGAYMCGLKLHEEREFRQPSRMRGEA